MADSNGRTTVIVALIGLVGTIAAAVLGNWDKIFPPPPSPVIISPIDDDNSEGQPSPINSEEKPFQIDSPDEPKPIILPNPDPKHLIWFSPTRKTRITNLNQICFGTSTLSSVQTVFGYNKPPFRGTITIPFPKTEGCKNGDTLQGNFELSGSAGNCVGTIKITWQNSDNAFIEWNISNLGSSCPVGTKSWQINTYPEPT